jgi:hypothetical protein
MEDNRHIVRSKFVQAGFTDLHCRGTDDLVLDTAIGDGDGSMDGGRIDSMRECSFTDGEVGACDPSQMPEDPRPWPSEAKRRSLRIGIEAKPSPIGRGAGAGLTMLDADHHWGRPDRERGELAPVQCRRGRFPVETAWSHRKEPLTVLEGEIVNGCRGSYIVVVPGFMLVPIPG